MFLFFHQFSRAWTQLNWSVLSNEWVVMFCNQTLKSRQNSSCTRSYHRNWIMVDIIIYQNTCKKLNCTAVWSLGCFQNLYILISFMNKCSLIFYMERICQQQINLNFVFSQIIDYTKQSLREKNKNTSTNLHIQQS